MYQTLYHMLVNAIDEALSLLEDGKRIKAHDLMQSALLQAEDKGSSDEIACG